MAAWQAMTDSERKEADAKHNETGKFKPECGPCPEGEDEDCRRMLHPRSTTTNNSSCRRAARSPWTVLALTASI